MGEGPQIKQSQKNCFCYEGCDITLDTEMKIMRILFSAILSLLPITSVMSQKNAPDKFVYAPVSPIHLIANSAQYDGKHIRLHGFLHYQFEDSAIYLSKDDADYLNTANAIWISYGKAVKIEIIGCKEIKEITKPIANDFKYFDGIMLRLKVSLI